MPLRRNSLGVRLRQRAGELGEDGQVGMQPDAVQATDTKRGERPIVLQAAELALDGGAATVELAVAQALARDQRVQPVALDPDRRGLALAGGAAPLGRLAAVVGS